MSIFKYVNMLICRYTKLLANTTLHFFTNAIFILSIILLTFCSCTKSGAEEASAMKEFEEFYQNFHEEEAFQLAHINFPLEGLPAHADAATIVANDFVWEAEDWVMQRPFDLNDGKFKREIISFGDDLVVEKIVYQNGKFATIRRFGKLGKEWYLIYYAGLNRIE